MNTEDQTNTSSVSGNFFLSAVLAAFAIVVYRQRLYGNDHPCSNEDAVNSLTKIIRDVTKLVHEEVDQQS
jgi:hypothetical protein